MIFGVGRSGFAHTYKTYAVDYGESRERFAETLHIVKRAFTEERFSHHGKYYAYDNVRLAPKPVLDKLLGMGGMGAAPTIKSFKGEEAFTSAILADRWVLIDRTCQIMFVGEGTQKLQFVFPTSTGYGPTLTMRPTGLASPAFILNAGGAGRPMALQC
jgi:hypothetical protein